VTNISWADSYLGQLRALAGDRTLLFVGARGVVRDDDGRVLLIRREVQEETGLTAERITPFAIYSGPAYTFTNMYGDTYQLYITSFRVDGYSGELVTVTDETTDARFFAVDELPTPPGGILTETLADLAAFERNGQIVMK
jgi:8-oxo-dGTP pyrophosphatase MutT (NUDIX family)